MGKIEDENQLKDVTLIMELIKDNLFLWQTEEDVDDQPMAEEEVVVYTEEEVNQSYS